MPTNPSFLCFQAEIKNLESLALIFDKYRVFYNLNSDLQGARDFLAERITSKTSTIFAAAAPQDPTTIVGFTQLYPSFSSLSLSQNWILYDLFVIREFRGQQIAKNLLQTAAEHAKMMGADGLTLKTATDNIPAQKLYESLGWKRDQGFYSYDVSVR